MKALEKDRTRRYETANGLARDIQRYLADEIVEARPPSPSYRLKKFVRRHKGQVIAAGLISLVNPSATNTGMTSLSASPDSRVLLFCLAVSVVASVLFSLAPIFQFYRPTVTTALKQQTGTAEGSHARFRRITVGVQIGLSLLLLVGAALFTRTLANLKSVDVGFVTDHLLAFQLNPRLSGYDSGAITPLYKRLIGSLSTLPGVQSVGMTDDPVLAQSDSTFSIEVPIYQPQEGERMSFEWEHVTPAYFETLQLPVLGPSFSICRPMRTSPEPASRRRPCSMSRCKRSCRDC
jgi:hypothetical protein